MTSEVWKSIKGWETLYEVSDKGRVRSLDRTYKRGNSLVCHRGKILKEQENNKGYKFVYLKCNGAKAKVYVHRLVAMEFVFKPNGMNIVNHKDFNPKNNCAENLEWTTFAGNSLYSAERGRFYHTVTWRTRLKESLDKAMGKPVLGESISEDSVVFYRALNDCARDGFQPSCVSSCCSGKRKTHAGFTWKFISLEKLAQMKEAWNAPRD